MPKPVHTHAVLLERAYALLARRDHARAELKRKLRRYDPPPEVLEGVIAHLAERGYLDDVRFARVVTGSLTRAGSHGPAAIRAKLQARGVDRGLIDDALEGAEADWDEACLALARKRSEDLEDPRARDRVVRFLLRRGFPPGVVFQTLARVREERRG